MGCFLPLYLMGLILSTLFLFVFVLIRIRIRICVDPDPFNVFFLQDVSEARWNFFLKPRSASIRECYRLLLYSLRKSNSTKISLLLSSYFTTLQEKSKWYLLIFILIFFHKSFVYSFIQLTRFLDDVSHWECWKNITSMKKKLSKGTWRIWQDITLCQWKNSMLISFIAVVGSIIQRTHIVYFVPSI